MSKQITINEEQGNYDTHARTLATWLISTPLAFLVTTDKQEEKLQTALENSIMNYVKAVGEEKPR